jgi:hypothetical protein
VVILHRKIRRRVKILWGIGAAVAFIFSAICTFLGMAQLDAIQFIFGHKVVGYVLDLRAKALDITAGQARLLLIVLGDIFFAVGLFYIFYIHFATKMARQYVTYGELDQLTKIQDELKELQERAAKFEQKEKIFEDKVAETLRRKRTIRTLHNNTAKMLKEMRERKIGQWFLWRRK